MSRANDILKGKTPEQQILKLDSPQKEVLRKLKDLQDEFGFHFCPNSMIYVDDSDWVDNIQVLLDSMP